jgi:hypothetical protein
MQAISIGDAWAILNDRRAKLCVAADVSRRQLPIVNCYRYFAIDAGGLSAD